MPDRPVLDVRLGDRVSLRKPHPCGSRSWCVVRLGADIGLVCEGCERRVLLERRDLERRFTGYLERPLLSAESDLGDTGEDAP
ncbi:hypothetical protein BH20CHL6_BH20CHL6_14410 [soil metagenome]